MNHDPYWSTHAYRGLGADVEVWPSMKTISRCRWRWSVRFPDSRLATTGFKSKFEALLWASYKCRRSMKKMNWTPIKERKVK